MLNSLEKPLKIDALLILASTQAGGVNSSLQVIGPDEAEPLTTCQPTSTTGRGDHFMDSTSSVPPSRGRGGSRGRSNRGGFGKYLRARGNKGTGRPAVWKPKLLPEGEGPGGEDDEEVREAREEVARKYAKRQLGSNADRYQEEPELDSEGAYLPRSTSGGI